MWPLSPRTPPPGYCDLCDGGTIRRMSALSRRLLPVAEPAAAVGQEFAARLSDSDLWCLVTLVKQGNIKVERDRETRELTLSPVPEVEPFLEQILT